MRRKDDTPIKESGADFIKKLKEKFKKDKDADLARHLGQQVQNLHNWRRKLGLAAIVNLVKRAVDTAETRKEKDISKTFIKPIVEYFPIEKESKQRKNYEIASPSSLKEKWANVLRELQESRAGIYIFYNSSGRAIYAGKTEPNNNSLWNEMRSAFNRTAFDERSGPTFYRVKHDTKQPVRLSKTAIPIHELASYFSAYKVHEDMVHNIEALLIRAFTNNLMNKKMETFKH